MRYLITSAFAAAEQAWKDAYAKHDTFAEAGDDDSPEAVAASAAEYDTLQAFTRFPATTATEIGRKLATLTSARFVEAGWRIDDEMVQIQRELLGLTRPALSPEIAGAVTVYLLRLSTEGEDTKDEDRAHAARCDAFRHLIHLPCFTPGDFLAKAYVEMLDSDGGSNRAGVENGAHYEIEPWDGQPDTERGTLFLETEAKIAARRDLLDCDLGRCLIGLGRVDFNAEAWLVLADRAKADVSVIVQADGKRGLYTGDNLDDEPDALQTERFDTLLQLAAFDHEERIRLIIDAIERTRPHRVLRAQGAAAGAETVAESAA